MARFAIGSIAGMVAANPHIQVPGMVPYLGSHLEIYWAYVVALFMGIVITHLLLLLSGILAVRKVAIKDDSFLAIARLLLPLLNVLGNEGTLLDGKELADAIETKTDGGGIVVGPRRNYDRNGGYYLDVGEEVPLRSNISDPTPLNRTDGKELFEESYYIGRLPLVDHPLSSQDLREFAPPNFDDPAYSHWYTGIKSPINRNENEEDPYRNIINIRDGVLITMVAFKMQDTARTLAWSEIIYHLWQGAKAYDDERTKGKVLDSFTLSTLKHIF
ncbi:MAG: hypothetical protein Q9221_008756, partial [Calogaya cf. arnoldii]